MAHPDIVNAGGIVRCDQPRVIDPTAGLIEQARILDGRGERRDGPWLVPHPEEAAQCSPLRESRVALEQKLIQGSAAARSEARRGVEVSLIPQASARARHSSAHAAIPGIVPAISTIAPDVTE